MTETEPLRRLTRHVTITIRPCRAKDLPDLEWFGWMTAQRPLILSSFERHLAGEVVMLVAEANHGLAGQVWIDLQKKAAERVGVLWAMRVIPPFQGMGLGSALAECVEDVLRSRDFADIELGVEKDNPGARRLYERLGFRIVGEEVDHVLYTTPCGVPSRMTVDQWVMRKALRAGE